MMEIEITTGPKTSWIPAATRGLAIVLRILMVVGAVTLLWIESARAALVEGGRCGDLLFGADDDDQQNPLVQPPGAPNQSLNDTDVMDGREGDDVMIALLGADVMHGGAGHDVLIGGTEQGVQPNSDVIFGDDGRDISVWRGGDGSDVFIGDRGTDALVMGAIDRDANNVPLISPADGRYKATGLPTADVTGQNGFCTLEDIRDQDLG